MFSFYISFVFTLNNGLALTPPMGWASWEQFRCEINCAQHPTTCISEKLFTDHIDRVVEDGFLDAGYNYVNIDDCWLDKARDPTTKRLVANKERFPHGIKWLADYAHSKNVNFGIYNDFGTLTCSNFAGSEGHLIEDAQTFADWGVDFLKMDGCYSNHLDHGDGYRAMTYFLNATGRPIVYSCSWPAYNMEMNYSVIPEFCNLWRNYVPDIRATWEIISGIIDYWGDKPEWIPLAGPGHWNDPDFVVVGMKNGLTKIESETQFAMWSIWASPLIISADLRNIDEWAKEILLNKEVIAIDQDKLGIQARRITAKGINAQVWVKELENNDIAVCLLNRGESALTISTNFVDFTTLSKKFVIRDLYLHKDLGEFENSFTAEDVPAHGVRMVRLAPK